MRYKRKNLVNVLEALASRLGYKISWWHSFDPTVKFGDVGLHQKFDALLDYLDLKIEIDSCKVVKREKRAERRKK